MAGPCTNDGAQGVFHSCARWVAHDQIEFSAAREKGIEFVSSIAGKKRVASQSLLYRALLCCANGRGVRFDGDTASAAVQQGKAEVSRAAVQIDETMDGPLVCRPKQAGA